MDHRFLRYMLVMTILLYCQVYLFSQMVYKATVYTSKDGLSSEICRNILQDKDGFLWITSDKGLNRFDGNSFYTFKHSTNDPRSISNNSCYGLLEDRKGRLWVNTDDGLSLFDRNKQTFENYFPDSNVMSTLGISYTEMAEDHLGRIWIGGYFDVLIFDPNTKKFSRSGWFDFVKKSGLAPVEKRSNISQSVKRKSDTELWLMTVYGLFSVHTPTNTFTYYPNPKLDDYFAFVIQCIDEDGVIWISTYDQCFYSYNPNNHLWKSYQCPPHDKKVSNHILSIHKMVNAKLLMTRSDQLFLFSKDTGTFQKFAWKELDDLKISAPFVSTYFVKDDVIIIKSGSQPFIHLKKKNAYIKKTKIPLPNNTKNNHSYITSEGKVLTGDWDMNTIYICDTFTCDLLTESNGNSKLGNLQLHFESSQGLHYFSTSKKIYSWSGLGKMINTMQLTSGVVDDKQLEFRNFIEDKRGSIYVRERSKGIFKVDRNGKSISYFDCGLKGTNFSALYYDISSDRLWLALEKGGMFIIDPNTRQTKYYPVSNFIKAQNGFIYDIVGSTKGDVFLMIANRGIVRVNAKQMIPKHYSNVDGLYNEAVRYGVVDNNGVLWFSTESGLMAFDEKNERFYTFENEKDSKLFTYRLFFDKDGNIAQNHYPDYFITMDRNSLLDQKNKPNIYLKEVKLSGKIIPNDTLFIFPYNSNNFVFQLGNFGESNLQNLQYQYRDNQGIWQPLENSSISLYNLSPGEYNIEVASKYHLDDVFKVEVKITPPWWKTTWFYTCMASLISILILGFYKHRINTIRKEEGEKNQLKQRIAAIEMTALRAQMNPHFIFNCLNSINRFILVNDTEAASEYLTKFSRLIRMILDGSRDDFITLDRELLALKLYIELESMRFQDSFTWDINIDHGVNTSDILVPPLLLQPYVENAIWHGLIQASDNLNKKLSILITHVGLDIVIEIADNGIGRDKAKELKSKTGDQHKSHGIALTEERLELMQMLKGIKTSVQIQDIKDASQKSLGTKVTITLKQP